MKIAAQSVVAHAAAISLLAVWPFCAQAQTRPYDGNWWMHADVSERSGFINGFSDCAVWRAHDTTFNTTPEQIADKITDSYQKHPANLRQPVISIWKGILPSIASQKASSGGETWKN